MGHPRIDHMFHPRQKGRMRAATAAKGIQAVCGRCGRRVDVLDQSGAPMDVRGALGHNENLGRVARREDVGPKEAVVSWGKDGMLVHRGTTWYLRCRSKCGARYQIKAYRLHVATERALEAGVESVVLGVDV